MAQIKTDGFIVIIEWDGKIPPTPYYHRLRKMTSGVRGNEDKDISVIARRAANMPEDDMRGLILQEGAIITPSESLAGGIAALAREYGAPMVHIGEVSLKNYNRINEADRKAMDRVNEAYGRRGRPHKAIGWMVTCMEEMSSTFVPSASYVPSCPSCGGFSITVYPANKPITYVYQVEKGGEYSLINEWLVTRFGSGKFMLPYPDGYKMIDPSYNYNPESPAVPPDDPVYIYPVGLDKTVNTVRISDPADSEIVGLISGSKLMEGFLKIDFEEPTMEGMTGYNVHDLVMNVLDGIFTSKRYYTYDQRADARIKSIMAIMADGYRGHIRMSEDENDIDILDASSVFAPEYMKGTFHTLEALKNA